MTVRIRGRSSIGTVGRSLIQEDPVRGEKESDCPFLSALEHDRASGDGYSDRPLELVNVRLTALGAIQKPRFREISSSNGGPVAAVAGRPVYFGSQGDFVPKATMIGPG